MKYPGKTTPIDRFERKLKAKKRSVWFENNNLKLVTTTNSRIHEKIPNQIDRFWIFWFCGRVGAVIFKVIKLNRRIDS